MFYKDANLLYVPFYAGVEGLTGITFKASEDCDDFLDEETWINESGDGFYRLLYSPNSPTTNTITFIFHHPDVEIQPVVITLDDPPVEIPEAPTAEEIADRVLSASEYATGDPNKPFQMGIQTPPGKLTYVMPTTVGHLLNKIGQGLYNLGAFDRGRKLDNILDLVQWQKMNYEDYTLPTASDFQKLLASATHWTMANNTLTTYEPDGTTVLATYSVTRDADDVITSITPIEE